MPITAWMDGLAPAASGPATGPQFDNRRALAALIDIALLGPVALLMATLFDGFTGPAAALTLGWALYYYFAFESDHGQTIGKRVMKIRVVQADGRPLDTGRAAVRTLLRPIDAIGAYLVGLVVMLATGQRRQRLGDLAAGTVVTDAGAPAQEPVVEATAAPEAPAVEAPVIDAAPPSAEDRLPEPPVEPEPEASFPVEPESSVQVEPKVVVEPEPEPPVEAEPEVVVEPEPEVIVEPEPAPSVEPEPEVQVEPQPEPPVGAESEPVVEPGPAPVPEDVVPVECPEDSAPPTQEPVPVSPPKPEREPMEIVHSPIDLVMQDDDEEPKPPQA